LPYVIRFAEMGPKGALAADKHLREGLNVHKGQVTYEAVAHDLGYEFVTPEAAFGI
jgi:alanine dehydrogenase